MKDNTYKVEGFDKRKRIYTAVVVVAAAVLAALVVTGVLSMDQIDGFVDVFITLVGLLGGLSGLVGGILARKNVEPPESP